MFDCVLTGIPGQLIYGVQSDGSVRGISINRFVELPITLSQMSQMFY